MSRFSSREKLALFNFRCEFHQGIKPSEKYSSLTHNNGYGTWESALRVYKTTYSLFPLLDSSPEGEQQHETTPYENIYPHCSTPSNTCFSTGERQVLFNISLHTWHLDLNSLAQVHTASIFKERNSYKFSLPVNSQSNRQAAINPPTAHNICFTI